MNGYKVGPRNHSIHNGFREAVTDAHLQTLRLQSHLLNAFSKKWEAQGRPPSSCRRWPIAGSPGSTGIPIGPMMAVMQFGGVLFHWMLYIPVFWVRKELGLRSWF
jgi:hypothetical protein